MESIMNDQTKFRAWDVKNKKFLPQSHFAVLGNGKLIVSDNGYYADFTNTNKDDYVVQRYTGLEDKLGKEIYEGDIVSFFFFLRDESGKVYDHPIESKAVVKYKEDSAEFVLKIFRVEGSGWSFSMLMTFSSMESSKWDANERIRKLKLSVIGDIFEHSELLK